jgi:prepilin-type N-terminal cleavage/methylation domain-containing protein
MLRRRGQKGFTLIELLIVVAIIGIIAAILIPNLLDALQKAKQKRTVSDIRNTGTAWMSWLTDQVGAGSAGQGKVYDTGGFADITYPMLFGYLHPTTSFFYMQEVPQKDGWRYELEFGKNPNPLDSNVLIICSGGRDGAGAATCEATTWNVAPFITTDYGREIVWADGYMVAWPGQVN